MPRTEEEIVGGYISVPWPDGTTRHLPVLKIGASRGWKASMAAEFGPNFAQAGGASALDRLTALDKLGTDALVRLVVAYDKGKVLGGKAGIEANLDDYQLLELYNTITEATFRFAIGLMTLLTGPSSPDDPSAGASSLSLPRPPGGSGPTASPLS